MILNPALNTEILTPPRRHIQSKTLAAVRFESTLPSAVVESQGEKDHEYIEYRLGESLCLAGNVAKSKNRRHCCNNKKYYGIYHQVLRDACVVRGTAPVLN